jgi:hypothetical protein
MRHNLCAIGFSIFFLTSTGSPPAQAACQQFDTDTHTCIGPETAKSEDLLLTVTPPQKNKALSAYGIYRVEIICKQRSALPVDTEHGFFTDKNLVLSHTIAITDQNISSSALPTADKTKAFIGVFAVSGETKKRDGFVNEACSTSFFVSARKPLYLIASASKATATIPSTLTQALYNVAKIAIPIWPLLTGTALVSPLKDKLTAIKDSEQPLKDFISGFDNGTTSTISKSLNEGTYSVDTQYSRARISITRLKSIIELSSESVENEKFRTAFEDTFAAFKDELGPASPLNDAQFAQRCSSRHNQLLATGLSSYDATYALGYAAHLAGLTADKVITCLGVDFAPIAAKEFEKRYWNSFTGTFNETDVKSSLGTVTPWPIQPPFPSVEVRYRQLMIVLGIYAQSEQPSKDVQNNFLNYVAPTISISNETDNFTITDTTLSNSDFIKLIKDKGFQRFGCVASDTQALGMFLVFPLKPTANDQYKATDALLIRSWFDADRRLARLRITYDFSVIESILANYGRRCGSTVVVAPSPK